LPSLRVNAYRAARAVIVSFPVAKRVGACAPLNFACKLLIGSGAETVHPKALRAIILLYVSTAIPLP